MCLNSTVNRAFLCSWMRVLMKDLTTPHTLKWIGIGALEMSCYSKCLLTTQWGIGKHCKRALSSSKMENTLFSGIYELMKVFFVRFRYLICWVQWMRNWNWIETKLHWSFVIQMMYEGNMRAMIELQIGIIYLKNLISISNANIANYGLQLVISAGGLMNHCIISSFSVVICIFRKGNYVF